MPNPYQAAADSQSAYAQGFSAMIRHLADQQSAQTQQLMGLNGAPMSQQNQVSGMVGDSGAGDVLYGQAGYIPSTAYNQTGSAYQQYIDSLPGIYQQQLAYNATLNAPRLSSSGGGSSGGSSSGGSSSDDGLTPYQMATLSLRADEIAYDRDQDDLDREFEILKFKADQADKSSDREFDEMIFKLLDLPKAQAAAAEDAADRAAGRNKTRQSYIGDLTSSIGGAFDDAATGQGLTKNDLFSAVYGSVSTQFQGPNGKYRFKITDQWVRNKVHGYVNSHYSSYRAGVQPTSANRSGNAAKRTEYVQNIGGSISGLYKDIPKRTQVIPNSFGKTRDVPPSYKTAFASIYSSLKSKYSNNGGKWRHGVTDQQVRQRVHKYLRGQGLRRPPKRVLPRLTPPYNIPRR